MIGLLQRVSTAHIEIEGEVIAAIGRGIVVFCAVEPADREDEADRLLARLLDYRVFPDEQGRMNLSLRETNGALLLVPQFTLAADTRKGTRASFSRSAPPELGRRLFEYLAKQARSIHPRVDCGRFGAAMDVTLTNFGPVTFWLQVHPRA